MFVVFNRIPVNPEFAEAFEARFAQRAGLVDSMPGFVSFHLLRPQGEGDPYQAMTIWESEDHFNAWVGSDAFRQQHGQTRTLPEDAFLGQPKIEKFVVAMHSAKADS